MVPMRRTFLAPQRSRIVFAFRFWSRNASYLSGFTVNVVTEITAIAASLAVPQQAVRPLPSPLRGSMVRHLRFGAQGTAAQLDGTIGLTAQRAPADDPGGGHRGSPGIALRWCKA